MAKRNFTGIAKVGYNHAAKQPICVKYRFNNKEKFVEFLMKKYPNVCWCNIYAKDINGGKNKGLLLFLWGKNKGFTNARC
jgi:hypothetical protein